MTRGTRRTVERSFRENGRLFTKNAERPPGEEDVHSISEGAPDRESAVIIMHGRSCMTIDPRISLQLRGRARRIFTDQADTARTKREALGVNGTKHPGGERGRHLVATCGLGLPNHPECRCADGETSREMGWNVRDVAIKQMHVCTSYQELKKTIGCGIEDFVERHLCKLRYDTSIARNTGFVSPREGHIFIIEGNKI